MLLSGGAQSRGVGRRCRSHKHLQVLHCVMFPRLEYDLPILSMDMVGKSGGAISLAVIDPCPVSLNRSLPPQYASIVRCVPFHAAAWSRRICGPL